VPQIAAKTTHNEQRRVLNCIINLHLSLVDCTFCLFLARPIELWSLGLFCQHQFSTGHRWRNSRWRSLDFSRQYISLRLSPPKGKVCKNPRLAKFMVWNCKSTPLHVPFFQVNEWADSDLSFSFDG